MMHAGWPCTLYLNRHGESVANVANERALAEGAPSLGPVAQDRDVILSARGIVQAQALANFYSRCNPKPQVLITSPFRRCLSTAEYVADACGINQSAIVSDERLRERALGDLNRLTPLGIMERFPEEVERRRRVGKFAYRPPRGESWEDVVHRLRPFTDELRARYAGADVVIVTHQAVLLCLRFVLEELSVKQLVDIDAGGDVRHCGVTMYERIGAKLDLVFYDTDSAEAAVRDA